MLTQCRGLRNVPSEQVECKPLRKISFEPHLVASASLTRLLAATQNSPGKFDDTFTLTLLNDLQTNLFRAKVDMKNQTAKDMPAVARLQAAIRVRGPGLKVSQMLAHPYLPLVALVYQQAKLVEVYRLEEQIHPAMHQPDFSLHGSYKSTASILEVVWVGDLD